MNIKRISQLSEVIDRKSHYFVSAFLEDESWDLPHSDLISFLAVAWNDPRFGWNFATSFIGSSRHIGDCGIYEIWIWRAYHHAAGLVCDEVIEAALAIDQSHCRIKANILKAVLVDFRLDWPEMARIAQVEEEVLRAYEALFFNVRGRDKTYVNFIVYPDGILSEMREDYIITEDIGNLMMRASYSYGIHEALELARIRTSEKTMDIQEACEEFKYRVLKRAELLVKLGGLNHKCPAIDLALQLILIEKKKRQRPEASVGIEAGGGLVRAIASDIARIKADDRRFHELVAQCDARQAEKRSATVK